MEKHLELKERFDQLMKQDMDVSEHEQEWFELLDDMHEWLKDKTIPRNIRRQFEPLGMLEVTMKIELDDMQRKKNDEAQSNRADSSGSADHT